MKVGTESILRFDLLPARSDLEESRRRFNERWGVAVSWSFNFTILKPSFSNTTVYIYPTGSLLDFRRDANSLVSEYRDSKDAIDAAIPSLEKIAHVLADSTTGFTELQIFKKKETTKILSRNLKYLES